MYDLLPTTDFDIETFVQRKSDATTSFEYNCHLRRLYPWAGVADTKRPVSEFGAVWVTVDPMTDADDHDHDEEETFIVIAGTARFEMEGQSTLLHPGDVGYVPRYWHHRMANPGTEPLTFIDIYWDDQGRSKDAYLASRN
ncbi:cupin domain-containing protein [Roseovarius sp. A21]|uniref:Cupin domain-containing protein n=1 Tax=Roseovarius bejariae TaxID=2576383 RepID=A0A844CQF8_9RHOB|nr:cupin domain-containing protein [Roseovarius bejariae]MRU17097.1 cupin domain-containing protein [Roseovarius bejariae]